MIEDKFEIRNCQSEDLSEIQRIERSSFSDPYSPMIFWTMLLEPTSIFRVAIIKSEEGEKIAGYSISKIEGDDDGIPFGHLISLAVAPSYRRGGIGARLVEDTISKMRQSSAKIKKVELEVRSDNVPAISLYMRLGFVGESTILNYYGLNHHAFRMKLSF